MGRTISLSTTRCKKPPNEVFPATFRRGRAAHLDIGGARDEAIRLALEDSLGVVVDDVELFGMAGSAGSTTLRLKIDDGPARWLLGKLYDSSHLRADRWYQLGRRGRNDRERRRDLLERRAPCLRR